MVIIGWLIILEGLFGIARPHALIDMVVGWPSAPRFYFSVIVRVVLGILFLFAAPRCRVPWLIYVLGIFVLLAGISASVRFAFRLELFDDLHLLHIDDTMVLSPALEV